MHNDSGIDELLDELSSQGARCKGKPLFLSENAHRAWLGINPAKLGCRALRYLARCTTFVDASRCISNFNDLIHVGCESSGDAKSGDFTAAPPCIQPYRAAVIDEFDRWIQDLSDSMRSGLLSKSSKFEARNSSCY